MEWYSIQGGSSNTLIRSIRRKLVYAAGGWVGRWEKCSNGAHQFTLRSKKRDCCVALHPDKIRCYTITHVSSSLAYFALVCVLKSSFSFQLTWLPVVRFFWPLSFFKWHWFWQSLTIPFTMNFFPLIEICGMSISTDEKVFLTISCYFSEAFVTYL